MTEKIALCLGYFDSVHSGHRELIHRCTEYAASHNMLCAVYTFWADKVGFFDSLYSFEDRRELLKGAGAQIIISDIFGEEIKNLSGEAFLDRLISKSHICAFFCGYDYTFGKDAACDAQFLADYAKHNKIFCSIMPQFEVGGEKVSTSRIKSLLKSGEIETANELLVDPYFIRGKVTHGRGVGKTFGIPTANIDYDGFLPREGVYKAEVTIFDNDCVSTHAGKKYAAVVNIGGKPTFDIASPTIEAMLIDFDGDLYGKTLKLTFCKYLRPIHKFESGEALHLQIQKDIKEAQC